MATPLVRTTRLATAYRRYLNSADAIAFASEVDRSYSPSTLVHLLFRGDVELRRAAALALGTVAGADCMEWLGRALADEDRGVRLAADDSFRALLVRAAAPMHHQRLLQVMHLIDGAEYAVALPNTIQLCDQAATYAEAHHQLAICWHGLGEFEAASRAYSACLWRCRFHYAAWQGLARCRVAMRDWEPAIQAFTRAVEINPDLESSRLAIRSLRRRLRRSR